MPKGTGTFLGIPNDWRRPTVERLKSCWWNRDDGHVFTPRAWGWGYAVNFAEVARRLRLRR